MKDVDTFAKWLSTSTSLGDKSLRDVVSRLRRVSKYLELPSDGEFPVLLSKLNINPEFKALSVTVRSQLRRAVALYIQFKTEEKTKKQLKLF